MNHVVRFAFMGGSLVAATCIFGAETPKVDPAVRTALSESPEATVIIVLRTQLEAPMVRGARAMYEPSIQSALSQLTAVSGALVVDERGVEFAQATADRQELAARQAIARSIDAVCKPEQDAFVARLSSLGGKVIRTYRAVNAVAARIPASALTALEFDDAVRQIALDGVLRGNLDVSTAAAGAPVFWNAGLTGAGQSIALIDSGVDVSHPAFVGAKIINGPVFSAAWPSSVPADNRNSPDDFTSMGHGTQMAGIIVGQGSPGYTRHYGVARGATLYNLKAAYNGLNAFDGGNHGGPNESYMPQADMLAALDYAVLQTPASIVNISYSAGGGSGMQGYNGATISLMEDIIATHNIAVVTSAAVAPGFASGSPVAPATVRNAIAVGAMDDHNTISRADDTLAPTNATGPTNAGARKPDLTAPGVNVLAPTGQWEGAQPDYAVMNEFFEYRSPSAAAAHVSGALALLRQIGITDMLLAKAVLINSAEGNGWTPNGGWGYLDLWSAKLPGSNLLPTSRYWGDSSISFDVAGPVNSGAMNITLAHERLGAHLYVFDRWTGQRVYFSGGTPSTVDKISLPNGNYLMQVYNGRHGGHFALAISRQGFEQVTIFRVGAEFNLNYDCYGSAAVALGSKFSITCTVTNPGDIEAHQVTGRAFMRFPGNSESDTACRIDFGSVPGHGTRSLSCLALASRPGPQTVCVDFVQKNKYYNPDPEFGGEITMDCYNTTVTGGGITGKVTVSGVPVEGVFVALTGPVQRSNKTNVNGEFALYDLLPGVGPYTVTPTKTGYTFNPPFAVVATLPPNQVPNLSFVASGNIPPGNTIINGNLKVVWSLGANKDAITELYWKGGPNLTRTFSLNTCGPNDNGNVEYFGNSMAPPDPQTGGKMLVGGETDAGLATWLSVPPLSAEVRSISKNCRPSATGVPVITKYSVGTVPNTLQIQRTFDFDHTLYGSYSRNFRPYVPRLRLDLGFLQVLYPATDGSLASVNELSCPSGCTGPVQGAGAAPLSKNWLAAAGWFAIHNATTGQGVVVSRSPSPAGSQITAQLWVDNDAGTSSNATSFFLVSPNGVFTGSLTEKETFYFYDSTTWTPSLTPPVVP